MRTLPLVPFMRERLLTLKEEQQENRRLCGRSYIKEYLEYVCVNEIGDLIKPHYVTESFPKLLKAKGMRQIRDSNPRCLAAHDFSRVAPSTTRTTLQVVSSPNPLWKMGRTDGENSKIFSFSNPRKPA